MNTKYSRNKISGNISSILRGQNPAKHHIMHKNKAGNLKSAMQLHVNAL